MRPSISISHHQCPGSGGSLHQAGSLLVPRELLLVISFLKGSNSHFCFLLAINLMYSKFTCFHLFFTLSWLNFNGNTEKNPFWCVANERLWLFTVWDSHISISRTSEQLLWGNGPFKQTQLQMRNRCGGTDICFTFPSTLAVASSRRITPVRERSFGRDSCWQQCVEKRQFIRNTCVVLIEMVIFGVGFGPNGGGGEGWTRRFNHSAHNTVLFYFSKLFSSTWSPQRYK